MESKFLSFVLRFVGYAALLGLALLGVAEFH
jgi:hypothetical protein